MQETRVIRLLPANTELTIVQCKCKPKSPVKAPVSKVNEELITIIRLSLVNKAHKKPWTCVLDTHFGPKFPTIPGPGVELDAKLFHKDLNSNTYPAFFFNYNSL